jgi:hypothetical protein
VAAANDWTAIYTDPAELRDAFGRYPEARYRPLPTWWWSGETIADERMRWQLEQLARMGCGALAVTGLAMHGPAGGSVADDPPGLSEEWYRFFLYTCERSRELGMGIATWSPLQVGGPLDVPRLLGEHPGYRGEELVTAGGVDVRPFGFDFGSSEAIDAHVAPESATGRYLERIRPLLGSTIVALFEDEFPAFPRWSPTFAEEFRAAKGYDFPLEAIDQDVGPRTPAYRVDLVDVATERVLGAYTRFQREVVHGHKLLGGYDQCSRRGTPLVTSMYHLDQFKTMSWANAPGTDHMGDARFHLSLADIHGAPRVWLEGFHSLGWGLTLDDQMRLIYEWAREGATLYFPHGMYYANRGLWWEWAPPDLGWNQPHARHYHAYAETVGRLLSCLSAGKHVPEVAVLYPQTTVWADSSGLRRFGPAALRADDCYVDLFGMHSVPSSWDLERADRPSLLAEAFYDRIAVDEEHVSLFDLPIVLPACTCLRTETVRQLIADAERGRVVVIVEPRPAWSAENGRDDEEFTRLVERLSELAVVVEAPEQVASALPPPRVDGLKSQWRRVGDLDLVFITGRGIARLRGMACRAPERWASREAAITPLPARAEGDDLLIDCEGPALLVALPHGEPETPSQIHYRELELPETWECAYPAWGENRWGDHRLPANEGTPPVERRTFAFREGDDPAWRSAPAVPEDVQQPLFDVGFERRMWDVKGRVRPEERLIAHGWREVVSTYGPKAVVDGVRLAEYSERLGVEDMTLATPIGLKGWVEPVKVDLGPGGAGTVRSWCRVETALDTHLVVEGTAIVTVSLDGSHLIGPVDCGLVSVPVHLEPGWHELRIDAQARTLERSDALIYRAEIGTRLGWVLAAPYRYPARGIWSWQLVHPDHKGDPGPRRFRRRLRVAEPMRLRVDLSAPGGVEVSAPELLEPGEHVVEVTVGRAIAGNSLKGSLVLEGESGTVLIVTDDRWEVLETVGDEIYPDRWSPDTATPMAATRAGRRWVGALTSSTTSSGTRDREEGGRGGHVLADVGWLEGESVLQGQVPQLWADAPGDPPPSWFCFTAPPGARALTLPIVGEVQAWLDGEAVACDGALPLREGARVALRVQAPAGFRGAACFTEHPLLELGPGRIRTGSSWHRQGLDVFAGVIVYRTTVHLDEAADAILDLGEVRGSAGVRVNGEGAGILFCAPWTVPVRLGEGENTIELEVASTLGPLAGRGVPTPFGPEDQRFAGIVGTPRLLVAT